MKLTDYIPTGKANAISAKDLARITGFKSVRDMQEAIHNFRVRGELICSVSGQSGGYYLPETDAEIKEFVTTLDARAIHTLEAVKSAKDYLGNADNQC